MDYIGLPFDMSKLESVQSGDIKIDMSNLNFKVSDHKRAAFLFLRNMNISSGTTFEMCSYEDKEEYLMNYLFGDIAVEISSLASTWLKILLKFGNINYKESDSILTDDEVIKFIDRKNEFIKEAVRLVISIPICTIDTYLRKASVDDIENNFEHTNYDGFIFANFVNILNREEIVYLISSNISETIQPVYYDVYFNDNLTFYLSEKLPYMNMLNLMMNPDPDVEENFLNSFNKMISD